MAGKRKREVGDDNSGSLRAPDLLQLSTQVETQRQILSQLAQHPMRAAGDTLRRVRDREDFFCALAQQRHELEAQTLDAGSRAGGREHALTREATRREPGRQREEREQVPSKRRSDPVDTQLAAGPQAAPPPGVVATRNCSTLESPATGSGTRLCVLGPV